jgi:putative ABC transport system permease protein
MPSLRTLLLLYKRHWRVQPGTELLAVIGVAAGVALLFAVQVTNRSVTGSFEQLSRGIAGEATIEAAARGPGGFDQRLLRELETAAGVQAAVPIVERSVRIGGPRGTRPVRLFGADKRVAKTNSRLLENLARRPVASNTAGIQLLAGIAREIGAGTGDRVSVEVGANRVSAPVADVADEDEVGSLAESPTAVGGLPYVQTLTGLRGRLTRILIVPAPGREAQATSSVRRLVGDRLNVRSTAVEGALLRDAAKPERQLTTIFAAISLVVGTLLAYSAMLLALAERRAFIGHLRRLGATDAAISATLLFDALALGLAGSLLGLVGGELLSRYIFHQVPGYLAAAFPIGTQRVVAPEAVALALAGGLFASLAAAAGLALSTWYEGSAVPRGSLGRSSRRERGSARVAIGASCVLIAAALALALLMPSAVPVAVGALAAGLVIALPPLVVALVAVARRVSRRLRSPALRVAVGELRSDRTRAVAVGAVGTLALFVILTIGGSVRDVRHTVSRGAEDLVANGDLWVLGSGDEDVYGTRPFDHAQIAQRLHSQRSVSDIVIYREAFLDLPDRRIWVVAVDPHARRMIAPSQFEDGDLKLAERRMRTHGWAALTTSLAEQRNLALGDRFTLPTPSGNRSFRLAATVANYGWLPGSIILNAEDYRRAWQIDDVTQLGVKLAPGTTLQEGRRVVAQALGSRSALSVQTVDEFRQTTTRTLGDTLVRLTRLSQLILVAAVIAVLAVTLRAIWSRRERLATLTSLGMSRAQLTRVALLEASGMLTAGCLVGLGFGLLGQAMLIRWTHETLETAVVFSPAWQLGLTTTVFAVALTTIGVTVSMALRLQAETIPRLSAE